MFKQELILEANKMRALRVHYISFTGAIAISVLSTFSLWAGQATAEFRVFSAVLISSGFFSALMWPIVTAVIASRMTDIEFSSRGWMLMATSGCSIHSVIVAKSMVGCFLLAVSIAAQSLITFGISVLAGAHGDILGQWALYFALLWVVSTVFILFYILVASAVEYQIFVLLVGVVSAFISVFGFLIPSSVFYFIPWGYYSQIVPFRQVDNIIYSTNINITAIIIFCVLSILIWVIGSRRVGIWR